MHLIDLSQTNTLIRISGEKAESFLQGQLTCDVREISLPPPLKKEDTERFMSRLSAHCNPKGRVLSSFRLFKYNETFYFCAPSDMAESIIKQLTPYARFSKVTLEIDAELSTIGIWGEDTSDILLEKLPQATDEMIVSEGLCFIRLPGNTARWILISGKGNIHVFQETHADAITENNDAWQLLDIQSNVATIHPETSALFTPHMLGYPDLNAVSFKKGCYTGQEVIARTQYLGKAKRHLYYASVASGKMPRASDPLLDDAGNEMGTVVNAALNLTSECYEFLAVIQDQAVSIDLYWDQLFIHYFPIP
jgi:folate-binding protein YgfZ